MVSITIRRLDESLKAKLRIRAAAHGHSMEEEAREILRTGLSANLEFHTAKRRKMPPDRFPQT